MSEVPLKCEGFDLRSLSKPFRGLVVRIVKRRKRLNVE